MYEFPWNVWNMLVLSWINKFPVNLSCILPSREYVMRHYANVILTFGERGSAETGQNRRETERALTWRHDLAEASKNAWLIILLSQSHQVHDYTTTTDRSFGLWRSSKERMSMKWCCLLTNHIVAVVCIVDIVIVSSPFQRCCRRRLGTRRKCF